MNANKSKTFFTDLKETIGFINDRVNKVTSVHSDIPTECNYCEAYQDLDSRLNDIKELKKEALNLKKELETKQDYFGNFFHDFQDLVLEIDEKVGWHEKYLHKFGYEPLNIEPAVEKEIKITPPEDSKNMKKDCTPSIYDFVDVQQINHFKKSPEYGGTKRSSGLESSGSKGTPQLCFDEVFEQCNKSPEFNTTTEASSPVTAASDCFGDYKNLARKLDF